MYYEANFNYEGVMILHSPNAASTTTVSFETDGYVAATGADDGTITLWNLTTYTVISHLACSSGPVLDLLFSADGDFVVSMHDRVMNAVTFHKWDLHAALRGGLTATTTNTQQSSFGEADASGSVVAAACLSRYAQGDVVAICQDYKRILIFEVENGRLISHLDLPFTLVAVEAFDDTLCLVSRSAIVLVPVSLLDENDARCPDVGVLDDCATATLKPLQQGNDEIDAFASFMTADNTAVAVALTHCRRVVAFSFSGDGLHRRLVETIDISAGRVGAVDCIAAARATTEAPPTVLLANLGGGVVAFWSWSTRQIERVVELVSPGSIAPVLHCQHRLGHFAGRESASVLPALGCPRACC